MVLSITGSFVVRRGGRRFVKPRALQNRALGGLLRGLVICSPGGVKHSSGRERCVSSLLVTSEFNKHSPDGIVKDILETQLCQG